MALSILIVDDNKTKSEAVATGLRDKLSDIELKITTVSDASSAKRLLRNTSFNAMILDLALPLRTGDEPTRHGGIELMKEVLHRPSYKPPHHVIGLTAHADIYESAGETFAAETWSLVFYEEASDVWLDRLAGKVRHIAKAEEQRLPQVGYDYDVAILVALPDELDHVRRNGWGWRSLEVPDDATMYFKAEFTRSDGSMGKAVAARAPLMGMSAASILATKMGFLFRPRVMLMGGICAGDSGQVALGDLIVGNPTWDYGSGKHVRNGSESSFEPAPFQIALSSRLRGLVERLSEASQLQDIRDAFPASKPTTTLRLHIGPFASGAAVMADEVLFRAIREQQHRKLMGIDMEAYGVMSAAAEIPRPHPECLVLKGVSDYADEKKDDRFRHYAAFVSAGAIKLLCEQFPI